MTLLRDLACWVDANRAYLECHGKVSFTFGPRDFANPSAHLLVVMSHDQDVEILLWESGEVEFNHGSFASSVLEHLELKSPRDLQALLDRFIGVLAVDAR